MTINANETKADLLIRQAWDALCQAEALTKDKDKLDAIESITGYFTDLFDIAVLDPEAAKSLGLL